MVVSSQFAWAWLKDRPWRKAALAGLGGFAAIALLAAVRDMTELGLLMPPFGASCVLAFGFPSRPFAQPKRLIGGHLIAAMAGLLSVSMFGYGLLGASIGVGLAIAAMMLTDTVHPPAGANPIVVALTQPGVSFLVVPVLLGATLIVTVSRIYAAGVARIERR